MGDVVGSGLSVIIDGKTGERRGETDLGFDGTGQDRFKGQ